MTRPVSALLWGLLGSIFVVVIMLTKEFILSQRSSHRDPEGQDPVGCESEEGVKNV